MAPTTGGKDAERAWKARSRQPTQRPDPPAMIAPARGRERRRRTRGCALLLGPQGSAARPNARSPSECARRPDRWAARAVDDVLFPCPGVRGETRTCGVAAIMLIRFADEERAAACRGEAVAACLRPSRRSRGAWSPRTRSRAGSFEAAPAGRACYAAGRSPCAPLRLKPDGPSASCGTRPADSTA